MELKSELEYQIQITGETKKYGVGSEIMELWNWLILRSTRSITG